MSVAISRALHAHLLSIGASQPEHELCGLLFGDDDVIDAAEETANVSPRHNDRFEVDPVALIAAHKAERAGGPRIVGHFHTHPNGVRHPSTIDNEGAAGDGALWMIIAGGAVQLWRSVAAGVLQPVALSVKD